MTVQQVAVVQAASIGFDTDATLDKAANLAAEAARTGASLALFPEAFIGSYPRGSSFGTVIGNRAPSGRDEYRAYWHAAIDIPGPAVERLSKTARDHSINLVVGVIERDGGTLYCTVVFIADDGTYLGKHRKLMPTGSERLVWGMGDGSTLPVFDTSVGRVGAVVCWENYMPLMRAAMYEQKIQLYCAPTADARDTWLSSMIHIALEGRCYVLSCNQFVAGDTDSATEQTALETSGGNEPLCRGGSVIVSPLGEILAGPNYEEETILYADIDLDEIVRAQFDFDVRGHYSRSDIFELHVDTKPRSFSKLSE